MACFWIQGYASVFHSLDLRGDQIVPEAFLSPTRALPLLQDHHPQKQVGWILKTKQDSHGLFVEGEVSLKEKSSPLRAFGLSVGMSILRAFRKNHGRVIQKARLHEISLVNRPAHPQAWITQIIPLSL